MLNRRHLRIKVLQALYAYFQSDETNHGKAERELLASVDRIYDLYLYMLLSFVEIKAVTIARMEEAKLKRMPTEEDLHPNMKMVDNKIFEILENHAGLRHESEQSNVNWLGDDMQEMIKKMTAALKDSEVYFQYMNAEETGFETDKAFAIALFKADIANSQLLYNYFEEKSIHWMDDIDLACSMVLKTLKSFTETGDNKILPLYKEPEEEIEFINLLFRKTIVWDKDNSKIIDDLTKNWEFDRIAKMDVLLMKMAITEFQAFNYIPKKVTLNEYIEISKFYSTPKSNGFINGILDKAIDVLEKDNKIQKIGRGLMN
jgi:transcription antitermination protein NusB